MELPKRKSGIDVSKYHNSSNFPLAGRAVPRVRFGRLLSLATLQGNYTRSTNLTRRNTRARKRFEGSLAWRFFDDGTTCVAKYTKTKMTVAECSFLKFQVSILPT